ncbi:uncharacterized protein [Antedon mediterranea]|uniref:uncharacterized protein n=1 Tax=Antedon mediterranea TaxID=105859 RepID=UPI003AF9EB12
MVSHYYFRSILFIIVTFVNGSRQNTLLLGLSGCPQLGCNPSGGFSFTGNLPLSNVTVRWQNDEGGQADSTDFGCIGTTERIVCPLRAPNSTLMGLDTQNGKLVWHSNLLHFPRMPLIDIYSDTIACDGSLLVPYDSEGNLRGTPIPFTPSMNPVFSLSLTDNDAFIISGYDGKLVTYLTDGVIHASIFLKANIDGVNGTFVPIVTPVVAGHRAYFLTHFRPDTRGHKSKDVLPVFRLYAVDILRQAVDRMKIIWFHTFKNKSYASNHETKYSQTNKNSNKQNCVVTKGTRVFVTLNAKSLDGLIDGKQLVNNPVNYPYLTNSDQSETLLYGFNDTGLSYDILFSDTKPFVALSATIDVSDDSVNFWAATNSSIYKINGLNGQELAKFNLASIFGEPVILTSKLMVVKKVGTSEGILILIAVSCVEEHCKFSGTQKHFVCLIDVNTKKLLWAVETPEDRAVKGQLIGMSSSNEHESKDLIVASAEGIIFAIAGY